MFSCLPIGQHYLADILAGIIVFCVTLAIEQLIFWGVTKPSKLKWSPFQKQINQQNRKNQRVPLLQQAGARYHGTQVPVVRLGDVRKKHFFFFAAQCQGAGAFGGAACRHMGQYLCKVITGKLPANICI